MDDLQQQEHFLETDEEENEEATEERIDEQEQSSDDYFSHSSTDTSIDLSEYKHLLDEPVITSLELPHPPEISVSDEEEEETLETESGTEILSEETELSDESAWDKEGRKPQEAEQLSVEKISKVSMEPISDIQVEVEEYALEQMPDEMEEMEEEVEEEEEEEQLEEEMFDEWEKERKISQFYKDLEEALSYEFPETVAEEEGMKLAVYENMLKELEKDDREIDVMLRELDRNEKTIHIIEKTLGPLITHYEKEVSAFRKVGDDSFVDFEGEEEEADDDEEVEDEYMSRAAEMAKEILEADDIESVGSLGKESSGDDLSIMLEQMAAELKEVEPEPEPEEVLGTKKAPTKQKRKTALSRRMSKQKPEVKKKKK